MAIWNRKISFGGNPMGILIQRIANIIAYTLLATILILITPVLLPLTVPLAFVCLVVPRLCGYYQRLIEEKANMAPIANFKQLPHELLQEIFIYCCGEEYVDFLYHFALYRPGPDERAGDGSYAMLYRGGGIRPEYNMAYILKGVCKDWKFLVEGTPALWQKIYLGDRIGAKHFSFRSLQHCENMMQQVLLPRSGRLPIQIKVRQCLQRGGDREFVQRYNNHMKYIEALFRLLAEHGSRWSSLEFENWRDSADGKPNTDVEQLLHTLSSSNFDNLHSLTLRPTRYWPRFDLTKSAPHLDRLALLRRWDPDLPRRHSNFVLQWTSITTLAINMAVKDSSTVEEIARLLHTVRFNLKHLVWAGRWDNELSEVSSRRLSNAFDGPHLELPSLLSLTLGGDNSSSQFSTTFFPFLLCSRLEQLCLLWCSEPPDRRNPDYSRKQALVPIEAVAQLLPSSPALQEVVILFTPISSFQGTLMSNQPSFGKSWRVNHGYLIFRGSRDTLRTKVAERLGKDAGMSSRLSLHGLSQHSPQLVKRMLSRYLQLVPWYTYSSRRKGTEGTYHIPHTVETPFERCYPDYCDHLGVDGSPILERTFSFIDEISRNPQFFEPPDTCILRDRALKALDSDSLCILADILDMVRNQGHSASAAYEADLPDTCVYTVAVAL